MSKNLEMELTTTPLTMNERLVKIHENPNVYTIDSFLTESECKYITESASKSLRDSVVSAATGGVASAGRTSKTTWLCYRRDPLLKNIAERSASVFKNLLPHVEWKNFEQLQIVKYQKGQEYRWHWDAYDFDSERGKRCTAERGQRLYTILFYLSDVEEGGETGFRDISDSTNVKPLKITPQIGKALVFQNVIGKTNRRDPKSLHAGLPVLKGEKWIANFWLRELPFDKQRPRYIPTQQPQLQSQTNRTLQNTSGIDNDIPFYYSIMKSNTEHNDVHKDYKRLYSTIGYFLGEIKTNGVLFNKTLLSKNYTSIKENDYEVVNNIYPKETAKVIRDYYYDMIKKGNFSLGDRQSNRYKARNDKISRVLNFDLVPLISKIVGKRMKASYTYFSGYIKGSDLPLHVDRAECEFTCSFFIAKDDTGISWPIYVEKQTDRGCTGRCNYTVTDEECIPLECEENGLIIFKGASKGGHAHMRKKYEGDYAYYVLLHFVSYE
tara:strand:+ start:573 stop:2054 length:1482 start_codon:yes stop_codon:yes gene_type:complete